MKKILLIMLLTVLLAFLTSCDLILDDDVNVSSNLEIEDATLVCTINDVEYSNVTVKKDYFNGSDAIIVLEVYERGILILYIINPINIVCTPTPTYA